MAEIQNDKTVIVDRDATDRRTPSGVVIALVVLAILALFFLLGGFGMFGGGAGNGDNVSPSVQTPTSTSPSAGQ